ncbi:50S ribosomal protein L21 [Alphaproteobacteria bacterium]|nr:50S ribosomal protein L21 [Alphaproteobacteria bacterium]
MYAVLKTGGKQYRVEKEDVVLVEKLDGNDGDQVVLNDILMIGEGKKVTLGSPLVNDAAVMAQVIRQTRGPKITMIYKRRRKNSRRKQGHKQNLTLLKIIDIAETGGSKLSPKKASIESTETKAKATAKPTETKAKVTAKPTETKAKATAKSTETKVKATAKSTETKAKANPKTKSSTTKDK